MYMWVSLLVIIGSRDTRQILGLFTVVYTTLIQPDGEASVKLCFIVASTLSRGDP